MTEHETLLHRQIAGIRTTLIALEGELRWLTSGQGHVSAWTGTPVHTSEVSDPTQRAALSSQARSTNRAIADATDSLIRAWKSVDHAVARIQAGQGPSGPAQVQDREPVISPSELAEANETAARRAARGGGYGAS